MNWSLGEIDDLCRKAARGAGKPWGIVEEVGWAIRWLARTGLPGPEALAVVLTGKDGLCPVTVGASLADSGQLSLLSKAGELAEPILILPFLSRIAPKGKALMLDLGGRTIHVWRDGTDLASPFPHLGTISEVVDAPIPTRPPLHARIQHVSPDALSILQGLAERTYAPKSETSRLRGAGAGLNDND